MDKLKLLDLYCCAGGAAKGYADAGFEVTGIDINPQPRYPFRFIQGDAIEYLKAHRIEYDAIHASPPCQQFSVLTPVAHKDKHLDLIQPTREILIATGKPYIIENVPGARGKLLNPIMLCGSMFELPLQRPRYFELSWTSLIMVPKCKHDVIPYLLSGTSRRMDAMGNRSGETLVSDKKMASGINWMVGKELDQAIPPAYTHYLGEILINHIKTVNHHAERR